MATFYATYVGQTYVLVRVKDLSASYKRTRYFTWYVNGIKDGTSTTTDGATNADYTFDNLESGKDYILKVVQKNAEGSVLINETINIHTKPGYFLWKKNTTNEKAFEAVKNQGKLSDFSCVTWNEIVDKLVETLSYYKKSWNSKYGSSDSARMSDNDKEMTAKRFNAVRYNIGLYRSTGLTEKNIAPGKPIMGYFFITIVNSLNDFIEKGP